MNAYYIKDRKAHLASLEMKLVIWVKNPGWGCLFIYFFFFTKDEKGFGTKASNFFGMTDIWLSSR